MFRRRPFLDRNTPSTMVEFMRTTVTLEPDVAAKLKEMAQERRATFDATLNDVLRKGLAPQGAPRPPRFVVTPHSRGFRPGVDPGKLNQLVDQLDAENFVDEAGRGNTRPS